MDTALNFDGPDKPVSEKLDIEVLVVDMSIDALLVQMDEDSKPFEIPRKGVKVIMDTVPYATLRLSESKAIAYNLV